MSKSRFDRGSTLGNGRWGEEEHPRGKDGRFTNGSTAFNDENETRDEIVRKIGEGKRKIKELEGKATESEVNERYRTRSEVLHRQMKLNRASMIDGLGGDVRKSRIEAFEKLYGKGSFKKTIGR